MPFELVPPGLGFVTVTDTDPTCALVAVPLAVSCVLDTKVVDKIAPPKETVAPFTKSLPLIVSVNVPTFTEEGVTSEICGIGFNKVTPLLAVSDDLDVSAASIVIVFGEGKDAGAV
jgi:hypothetical protein